MATNKEWLFSLPLEEQYAWMNAEHTESPTSETMQHIGQVIEDTVMRGVYGDTAAENADSRELIITDLEKKTREWHDYDGNFMRIYSDVAYAQIKELLDRQAAITAEETSGAWGEYRDATQREIAELTAERDELKGQVFTLKVECDDLTSACDDLENELYKAKAERERYRSKFGKCLDYADAIHALMDDEGMA